MSAFKALRGVGVSACLAMGLVLAVASGAWAAAPPIYLCIGTKASQGVKSGGTEGKCPVATKTVTYDKVALPSEEAEQQKLLSILPDIKYVASGVGGKPTIQVSGANLQILSGSGSTNGAVNGAGNLVIGYDENAGKHEQTGSHDLVLGEEQTFTSFASILGGFRNTASGSESFVVGEGNTASGQWASVSGGRGNKAEEGDSVSGGSGNTAENGTGDWSSVSGGAGNTAAGLNSSVSGGGGNRANWINTSVSGGEGNAAGNMGDSVSGGRDNYADGGGYAYGEHPGGASVSGGEHNNASQIGSSISGGEYNVTDGCWAWAGGGYKNKSGTTEGFCKGGTFTSIFGGKELKATHQYQAIP